MKNYFRTAEQEPWPFRTIVKWQPLENTWDDFGAIACRATLECGHSCILTGDAIHDRWIHCKPCGETHETAEPRPIMDRAVFDQAHGLAPLPDAVDPVPDLGQEAATRDNVLI